MQSNAGYLRPLKFPSENFGSLRIPVKKQLRRFWFRVHRKGVGALDFSVRRHHRYSHCDVPYKILYLATNIQTALWEVFGDDVFRGERVIAASRWNSFQISRIETPQLNLCELSAEKTRSVMGVDKSSLLASDLAVPQSWGLAIQNHPAGFDGIKYTSRFIDRPCLALFEKPSVVEMVFESRIGDMNEIGPAIDWLGRQRVALV